MRALSAALDLTGATRDAFFGSARSPAQATAVDELTGVPLPVPLTVLLGRDADVRILRQWLADPAARLITLLGPGGVGKTRLALELARAIADGGATRVVFVPLAAIQDPAFVQSAIAEGFGLVDVTARDLPARARVACGNHSTLLVLDNFEQVLDAAGPVADLLISVPMLRMLVTSRAPLRVRGEREYVVGPLELATTSDAMSSCLRRVRTSAVNDVAWLERVMPRSIRRSVLSSARTKTFLYVRHAHSLRSRSAFLTLSVSCRR